MPNESFNFKSVESGLKSKESLGQEFKKILHNTAKYYDENLSELNRGIAGEEFNKANRSSFILKSSIKDFINIPDFPAADKSKIFTNLALVDFNDPAMERLHYHQAKEIIDKNSYAVKHNDKFLLYKSSVRGLLDNLQNVLPENMYQELLLRNDMFTDVLNWIDINGSKD